VRRAVEQDRAAKEDLMDSDEIKGKINRAKGTVKEKVGDATDNPSLEAEGTADRAKGNVQEGLGAAKRKVKETVDDLTDDKK
jgi:uncharacterized protein YjbJ (UPF0337 family)